MQQSLSNQSFSTAFIAAALGVSPQAVSKRARKQGWRHEGKKVQGGGSLWLFAHLDSSAKERVAVAALRMQGTGILPMPSISDEHMQGLWDDFQMKSNKIKDKAAFKYRLLTEALHLYESGSTLTRAFELIAQEHGVKVGSLRNWYFGSKYKRGVRGIDSKDWLPLLADKYRGRVVFASCDSSALDYFISDYLRREAPSASMSYRSLRDAAQVNGWAIPSEKTMLRMVWREYTQVERDYARTGSLRNAYPSQERRRDTFVAGEAVSGDGLKFDKLWIIFPDGEVTNKTTAWFWEDIYSAKILAYDVDKSENTDMFRRATYNLTGITLPRKAYVDNTRVAANKSMTGQARNRHRFTDKRTDPVGLMSLMGIDVRFTNPDQEQSNPGAKPIERAFGIGGLHDALRHWPPFQNRGFSMNTAIPLDEFKQALEQIVAAHNARTGRTGGVCNGRSFDEVFAESFAMAQVRKPSEELRNLLLRNQEVSRVSPDGTVRINAGRGEGKHRYYGECLVHHVRENVAVLYNPESFSSDVTIYDLSGKRIGTATWLPSVAFDDADQAREWGRERNRRKKSVKNAAASAKRMSALERQQLNSPLAAGSIPRPGKIMTTLSSEEVQARFNEQVSPEKRAELRRNLYNNLNSLDEEGSVPFAAQR